MTGETPNLAARLQTLAEPGTVMICPNTRRLTEGHFEFRELGPVAIKGWTERILCYRVLRTTEFEGRFHAQHKAKLAPLLGRDEETDLLIRRWRQAKEGEGRVVVLTGEPGIGKSHITLALQELLKSDRHTRLTYFCSAHHTNSTLFPFIGQLERAARFERGEAPKSKFAKLESLLAQSAAQPEHVALLASLLSLPENERYPLPDLSPQKRKERTLAAFLAQLDGLTAKQPILAVCEDVHWIDPTSLELLSLTVERMHDLPVLWLITARPEFIPPWPSHTHVTTLPLTRLGKRDGAALVERVAGGKLPDEVMKQILARTDGVPLFVEELTKTVLESGLLQERQGQYVLDRPLPSVAIPTTLQASLTARLDRLSPVRDVAQIGAVVGREFSYELLSAVAGLPADRLNEALNELVRSELVFQRGEIPQAVYTFKHALVRDAAYSGLLKSRRAQLHAAIAEAFEQQFPEIVEAEPETLAHHLMEAGEFEKATKYWLKAGRKAAMRSANVEAIAHLRRGVEATGHLPESAARDRLELDFQFAMGPCMIAIHGPASTNSVGTFARARELCERLGDPPEYVQVMFWLATAGVIRGELPQAEETVATLHRLAETRGDRPGLLNALRGRAMILLFMGRVVDAHEAIDRAYTAFNESDESQKLAAGAAGQDAGVASLALMSWALWLHGAVDMAVIRLADALKRADAIEHPHSKAYAYHYGSILHALRGEHAIAQDYAQRCLTLSEEHEFRQWLGLSRAIRGTCTAMLGASANALEDVTFALSEYRNAGYQLGITALYILLCPPLLRLGQSDAALEVIDQGLATAARSSERIFEAELYRLKAQAIRTRGIPDATAQATKLLEQALAIARQQRARSLELRAARDLAVLLAEQGKADAARDLLRPVYSAFAEGFETQDLKDAKALLERLGA